MFGDDFGHEIENSMPALNYSRTFEPHYDTSAIGWSIYPALNSCGLSFNTATGAISGNPTPSNCPCLLYTSDAADE